MLKLVPLPLSRLLLLQGMASVEGDGDVGRAARRNALQHHDEALRRDEAVRKGNELFGRHGHGGHPAFQGDDRDAPQGGGNGSAVDPGE